MATAPKMQLTSGIPQIRELSQKLASEESAVAQRRDEALGLLQQALTCVRRSHKKKALELLSKLEHVIESLHSISEGSE